MSYYDEIVEHAALAFYGCAWADLVSEEGSENLSGVDILDVVPMPIPKEAMDTARSLIEDVETNNKADITTLYKNVLALPAIETEELTPSLFGHYLAMEALGHGVGLWMYREHSLEIPDVSFFAVRDGYNGEIVYV